MTSVNFRPVKPDEIAELAKRFSERYPWAAEPAWTGVWVLEENGKIEGFVGFQQRLVVEPLFSESPRVTRSLIDRLDTLITANRIREYEFIVPDQNQPMQETLERHYGLKGEVEIPHKIFLVKRD